LQSTQPTPVAPSPLLTKTWYANYVLGALTLCYVLNTMDRSQILAASVQAIKKDFGASDFQMGVLTGIPFALFYAFMGIPIAAWADRSNRRNVLTIAVATWSAMTAIFGTAVNYGMLFAARVGTAIGEAGGSPPSHSLISDYFPKLRRGTAFSIFALGVPIGTSLAPPSAAGATSILGGAIRSSSLACPGS
jgi:MFS family permease